MNRANADTVAVAQLRWSVETAIGNERSVLAVEILDGGHMLMLMVEGLTRRTMSLRARKAMLRVGALAMLLLLATTFYNDLGRLGLFDL